MTPLIKSRQKVTLVPIADLTSIKKGDIVLCKVRGSYCTHLVKQSRISKGTHEFLIGNNHGHVNGWTRHVYGKCIID